MFRRRQDRKLFNHIVSHMWCPNWEMMLILFENLLPDQNLMLKTLMSKKLNMTADFQKLFQEASFIDNIHFRY